MDTKMPNLALLSIFSFLAFLFIIALPSQAQDTSVSGTVVDQAGLSVPGATVTLTGVSGAIRTVETDLEGAYRFLHLRPGTFQIRAELQGFKTAVVENLDLMVDSPATITLVLEIGEISETVMVEASAIQTNTTNATLGNAFEGKRIRQLPLESRNVANLLSLQPAVTEDGYVSGSRSDQSNLTLDGIDVNDQQEGIAFETVLRVNPDSVQEFRVTTSTPDATQGRSSGGQVSLVTRTGTDAVHGSVYFYHRNTATTANNFFNNRSSDPKLNEKPPKLLRNLFGASLGGPVFRDRAYFFYNYEGRRDAKEETVLRQVPLASLGQGIVKYFNAQGSITTLTTEDINRLYPAVGVNPIAVEVLADAAARYPSNEPASGRMDVLNTGYFRFNAPKPLQYNAHTATLSFNLDPQARHVLTLRGNLQHDKIFETPKYPDTPIPETWSHPTGFGTTYTWTATPKLVHTLRLGLTRQAFSDQGDSGSDDIKFAWIYAPGLNLRKEGRITPTWNIVNDLSWVKGSHTWQFGSNIRIIRNQRESFDGSYDSAATAGGNYSPSFLDPLEDLEGQPSWVMHPMAAVIGRLNAYGHSYNFYSDGSLMPPGSGVRRNFATEEYEFYAQDTWRLRQDLTLTLGMRYGINTPVRETNGFQVKPTESLAGYFDKRVANAARGIAFADLISLDLAGPANNGPGYYSTDTNNFAPRAALAWSPSFENGLLRKIFGSGQKSVFRAGFAKVYDRIGSRLAVSFDLNNMLGFSTSEGLPRNFYNTTTNPAPLFTGFDMRVRDFSDIPPPAPLQFPRSYEPDGARRIEETLDDSLTTPSQYTWNLSIAREFGAGITVEAAYLGRAGRNLLATRDIMHPLNLVDKKSGMDWYTAAGILSDERLKDTPVNQIAPIPYFENLFPEAHVLLPEQYRDWGFPVTQSPTQAAYVVVARDGWNTPDWTLLQDILNNAGVYENSFYQPQYAALNTWSTIGYSDYHAGTLSVRQRLNSLNLDFNYTFSKSTDIGSGLERMDGWNHAAFVLNPLNPDLNHGVSDFDLTHIINTNALWELPLGKGRRFLNGLHPIAEALIGGWQLSGIFRWNSGLPAGTPGDGLGLWATNWQRTSWGTRIKPVEPAPRKSGDSPNFWADPQTAYNSFRNARAGEVGQRNLFRVSNYIVLDFGLAKSFVMPWSEQHRLQFRWEVFNATNTQVLGWPSQGLETDSHIGTAYPGFGNIDNIQGKPRVMQFALRYEF